MHPTIKFYSNKDGEIFRFLSKYYDINEKISQNFDIYYHSLEWQNSYENPIEIATIPGTDSGIYTAARQLVKQIIPPTDKSVPPIINTRVCPIPTNASVTHESACRFNHRKFTSPG